MRGYGGAGGDMGGHGGDMGVWGVFALTGDEVAAHEGLAELGGVAVLGVPQRPALRVKVLPQVRQRHRRRVLVGVFALEFVQHEWAAKTTTQLCTTAAL